MDWLTIAEEGIKTVEAPELTKKESLRHLERWLVQPEFQEYRPQMQWLIQSGDFPGLVDRFFQILPFGTGGRRGSVGIGPNRMNSWTLGASVQGHSNYLRQQFQDNQLSVAIAYDVRSFMDRRQQYCPTLPNPVLGLSSRMLAELAAKVYAANGIKAWILPQGSERFISTPELSFTIRHMQLYGGLNISASHNPPDDNGGKFYNERGGQHVPPEDQLMADLVDGVQTIHCAQWQEAVCNGMISFLNNEPHQSYLHHLKRQSLVKAPIVNELIIIFTPLHGVGAMTAMELLEDCGFNVIPVLSQMTPDGQFPNVTKTPNPEAPESMDKAGALATELGADLVLATDPDADRLGAMVPDELGKLHFLTGNHIAAMLTAFKLAELKHINCLQSRPIVIKTEVTTRLIKRICTNAGAQLVGDLLVGFKYIAEVLRSLEDTGTFGDVYGTTKDFIIATEESHGVLVTSSIRDKDAAGAALLMAELVLTMRRRGISAWTYLQQLHADYGYFRNEGVNIQMEGITGRSKMIRLMDSFRRNPPKQISTFQVTKFADLRDPAGRFGPIMGATDLASRNVLIFEMGESARVVLRPSGTEPKAKAYFEVSSVPRSAGSSDKDWMEICSAVDKQMAELSNAFINMAVHLAN